MLPSATPTATRSGVRWMLSSISPAMSGWLVAVVLLADMTNPLIASLSACGAPRALAPGSGAQDHEVGFRRRASRLSMARCRGELGAQRVTAIVQLRRRDCGTERVVGAELDRVAGDLEPADGLDHATHLDVLELAGGV